MAVYTPTAGSPLAFHLLVDPPTRETRQQISERLIPGSNNAIVDVIGKAVTKIRGQARFDGYAALKTFEGAVGTGGLLQWTEEPAGVAVIFVSLERNRVTPNDIHLAQVEFWLT